MSADNENQVASRRAPAEITADYQAPSQAALSARRPKVLLLTGAAARDNAELRTLLRQRLRLIAAAAAIASALGALQKSLSLTPSHYARFLAVVWGWPDL